MLKSKGKNIYFSGVEVQSLAQRVGTPFFLFSEKILRENYREFNKTFSSGYKNTRIDYSVKTNNEISVLKILAKEGSWAEIVAGYELELCKKAGFPPHKTIFDGPCKSDEEIELGIKSGIHAFYADSVGEFDRLNALARKMDKTVGVGLRINLGLRSVLEGPAETYIGKFGVDYEKAFEILVSASTLPNLKVIAISTHLGSQILSVEPYLKAVGKMFRLASELYKGGIAIQEINLGGGFPSQTLVKMTLPSFFLSMMGIKLEQRPLPISIYGREISSKFSKEIVRHKLPKLTLAVQPGRSISSSMGIAVAKARVVKKNWVFLDISTSSLPESIFFAKRRLVVLGKKPSADKVKYSIAGRGLNSADNFAINESFPEIYEGDTFIILDAGAYSISRANRFTTLNPPVYMIRESGKIEKVRREETFKDVLGPMEF